MDAWTAKRIETWSHESAALAARFNFLNAMTCREMDTWKKKDVAGVVRVLERVSRMDVMVKRFCTLIEDHRYWAKRWTEAGLIQPESKF